jgi:hypothetical protein
MRRAWVVPLVVLVGACGARTEVGGAAGSSGTTIDGAARRASVGPKTATTADSSSSSAVLAAVDGFVTSTVSVNDPPDPTHPDLARYRTGAVLANAVATVRGNQRLGIAYRRAQEARAVHRATVMELTAETAVVRNCVVDDTQQVALADGEVLNDATATKLFETTLELVDGLWKVAENSLLERWEGVGGCAA